MFIDRRRDSWNGTPRHIRAAAALAGEAAGVALVSHRTRLPAGLIIIPLAAEVRVHVAFQHLVAHVAVADADAPERAPQQAVERVLAGRVLHADLEHVRAARRAVALDGACGAVARRRGGVTLLSGVASRVASWTCSRGGGAARFHSSLAVASRVVARAVLSIIPARPARRPQSSDARRRRQIGGAAAAFDTATPAVQTFLSKVSPRPCDFCAGQYHRQRSRGTLPSLVPRAATREASANSTPKKSG